MNERIEDLATAQGAAAHVFEFFCECSNIDCNLLLPMTVSQYEEVRRDPRQFAVAPGHELPEIESVVARRDGYQVVRKHGEAADFVAERNPRSQEPD